MIINGGKNQQLFYLLWNAFLEQKVNWWIEEEVETYMIKSKSVKVLMTEFRCYDIHCKILSIYCVFEIFHNKIRQGGLEETCFEPNVIWLTTPFSLNCLLFCIMFLTVVDLVVGQRNL